MCKIVVIGTSLGGLSALKVLLGGIPKEFPVPIAVVQHRHKSSEHALINFLQQYIPLPLREVEDKDEITSEYVHLAPADYHLLVEPGYFTLSTDAPVCYARPSIDVLFESAADVYADQAIAVVLTGANQDGAQGAALIKTRGGLVIVQEPATSESSIMPQATIATTEVDAVLPLVAIAPYLIDICMPLPERVHRRFSAD